jgi:general stress protein YciG
MSGLAETERERESRIIAEVREIMARRGGQARAQALTEKRRREIASKAGKAAAENLSSDERAARARRAARMRWAAQRGFAAYMAEL